MSDVPTGNLVIYQTEDGEARVQCRFDQETLWLTQAQIAKLFETTPQNVTLHLKALFAEGELTEEATCKEYLQVRQEGNRLVSRSLRHYRLEAILAIGYRVRSPRGTQFRQWATARLSEYLVKGFVMDDERLKNPGGWDYFDELLARIREIRASEKRFYQKVRDLFTLSSDYQAREKETQLFFAEVQNKLLFAVTGKTAAELIIERANPDEPNMSLTTWSGSRVRKHDVIVAKKKQDLTLDYWRHNVDRMLAFNEQPVLEGAGSVSREQMKEIAEARYADFDAKRREAEAIEADAADLKALEELEKALKRKEAEK